MKHLYDNEDILTYKTNEIPLNTTVIIKTKCDVFKGKLIQNDKNCIAIDYPKELKGTYLARDSIESIRIVGSFSDLINLITKKENYRVDNSRFFDSSNIKPLNYKDLDGKTLKMAVVDNKECLLVAGVDKETNTIYILHSEVK